MIASFVFLRGFLIRGFVAESVESSAASAVLFPRCSGFRLYDDLSPLRLVRVEAGTSSFSSARQQPITILDSPSCNAERAVLYGANRLKLREETTSLSHCSANVRTRTISFASTYAA